MKLENLLSRSLVIACLCASSAISAAAHRSKLAQSPGWTLRYYTLRGAAIDFMLNYPSVFAKNVGGKPILLKNETYRTLASLASRFSVRFASDDFKTFLGSRPQSNLSVAPFLGKPLFVGDSHGFAGFTPSEEVSHRDVGELLRAGGEWHLAVEQANAQMTQGQILFWRSSDSRSMLPAPPDQEGFRQLIDMMNYMAAGRPPFGFLLQYHIVALEGCGDSLEDGAFPRYANVKIAVVENNSGKTLNVGGFLGGSNGAVQLRTSGSDDRVLASGSKALNWGSAVSLPAGSRLIVPLRIAMSYSDYEYASPEKDVLDEIGARPNAGQIKMFLTAMRSNGKGLVFKVDPGENGKSVAISFAKLSTLASHPWRNPLVNQDFVYGPSARVSSVSVSSGGSPRAGKTQSINYTTAEGFGSCPFLFVWDKEKEMWLSEGRVLVNRVGPAMEHSEVYNFKSPPAMVSLREQESEVTHLTDLYLEVTTPKGEAIILRPIEGFDWLAGVLRQGDNQVFRFDVPKGLETAPARLHVSGYYIREPRIRMVSRN